MAPRPDRPVTKITGALAWLCLALAACGGGGDGDAGSGGGGGGTATETPGTHDPGTPVTAQVFADPSGPLCSTRSSEGICDAPTASMITFDDLIALQRSPSGQRVRFDAIGVEDDAYWATAPVAEGIGVTNSSQRYALLAKPLVLGGNQVTEDGAGYTFDSAPSAWGLKYKNGSDEVTLTAMPPAMLPLTLSRSQVYQASGTITTGQQSGRHAWLAAVGPLTDRASAPTEAEIDYSGMLHVMAGDGSPAQGAEGGPFHAFGRFVSGSCPITARLSPASGRLTTGPVDCTALGTQASVRFTLAPLTLSASRVAGALGNEASIRIEGPSAGLAAYQPTTVIFETARISGAVYGQAASGISVSGAGAQGRFIFHVYRQ